MSATEEGRNLLVIKRPPILKAKPSAAGKLTSQTDPQSVRPDPGHPHVARAQREEVKASSKYKMTNVSLRVFVCVL